MLARHLPLLWTFAGGCLSGAALIALWPGAPGETETVSAPKKQRVARTSEAISPASSTTTPPATTTTDVRERALPNDAPDALPGDAPDARAEPGSSVADVLASLEAAYRQGLSAAAPSHAPSSPAREPATSTHTEAPTSEVPASSPAPTERAAALPVTALPATQGNTVAHPVAAPDTAPAPVLAARDDTQPSNVNVHVGDNNQTTHVGDVIQGNVILVQAPPVYPVYGYPQVFAPTPQARGASLAYTNRGVSAQFTTRGVTAQRAPGFASSWTVPNDRLGYDSALVPMLK